MKASKYNILFQIENNHYLYNTLKSGLIGITEELSLLLKSSNIKAIPTDDLEALAKQGFIVSTKTDELAYYEYYYRNAQHESFTSMRFVVLPTYECNLRCTYCYQESKQQTDRLDKQKRAAITEFISQEISNKPLLTKIQLSLYGGEPLFLEEESSKLAKEVRELAVSKGLSFESAIITNATLINEKTINELFIPNNMRIQITVDGSKSTHDTRRVYRDGKGSYDQIYQAITLLNQYGLKDNIALRLNIDYDNLADVENVLETFSAFVDKIYVRLIKPIGDANSNNNNCISTNDYLVNILPKLKPLLQRYKVSGTGLQYGKKPPCGLNKANSYIIDGRLDVYKCEGFVANKELSIGRIDLLGNFIKNNNFFKQMTWSPFKFPKCVACNLLPVCASSCAYHCYLNHGDINQPYCEVTEKILINDLTQFILTS